MCSLAVAEAENCVCNDEPEERDRHRAPFPVRPRTSDRAARKHVPVERTITPNFLFRRSLFWFRSSILPSDEVVWMVYVQRGSINRSCGCFILPIFPLYRNASKPLRVTPSRQSEARAVGVDPLKLLHSLLPLRARKKLGIPP